MTNPVVAEILRQGRRQPGSRRDRRRRTAAALQIGRVESNFTEIAGGDADSQNWRQERASVYGNQWRRTGGPLNTKASVRRVFSELAQLDRGQPSYELAADVQRPREDLRGRYRDAHGESMRLLRGANLGGASRPSSSRAPARPRTRTVEAFDQAGYDEAVKRQRLATFLQKSGRGNSVLFRAGLLSTKPVAEEAFAGGRRVVQQIPGQPGSRDGSDGQPLSGDSVNAAVSAAQKRIGIKEVGTSNRSREVDRMQKSFGMIGQPWCGIYLGTVLREAGVRNVDSRVASVAEIERMARNGEGGFRKWTSGKNARAGDAVITRKGQHVAFVERVDRDGTIHVIGGNQSGGVTRTTWKSNQVHGIARPRYRR